MAARFDHLVVAVEDLDDAMARWTAAGLPAARGGAHPVGTVNALVRGPGPAYVELIAPGSDESNVQLAHLDLDGVGVVAWPDRRRFVAPARPPRRRRGRCRRPGRGPRETAHDRRFPDRRAGRRIDDAFVLALSGGVYAVRGRRRSVTRSLDGWGSSGRFADGEAVQWLEQAAAGRRTDGVVAGEPWLS